MFMKKLVFLCAFLSFFSACLAFSQETMRLPCEVMESSDSLKSSSAKLNGVRYLLLHQANSADREAFSTWLKNHSETEVTFVFNGKEYVGILCRLAHCFGRGLLIYDAEVRPMKRDIIEVLLPQTE